MASPLSFGSVKIYNDQELGIGSYGKVCKAKRGQLPCAAKLLHDTLFQNNDPGTHNLFTKFQQECQFLSGIKHPNIVQYLGTATNPQSRRPVLLMELMDENLTKFLERASGPLPYHTQLNICHDVALALAYLHSNAIIHRDLSSNNVLLIGEGSRAKVTDFGMSKLMDMNPRMTSLSQVPGTPAYMSPEALTAPPRYSSPLDCFSHGVLTVQIITRNFPNPGDATIILEDRRFPTGQAYVPIPEVERRKKDIGLIEPSHPLRPIALHCLKDRDTERPSADELCGRLVMLKREPRYAQSVKKTRGHIQRLQGKITRKDCELKIALRRKEQLQTELKVKDDELERIRTEHKRVKMQLQREMKYREQKLADGHGVEEQPVNSQLKLAWTKGKSIPEEMKLTAGAAVVHGDTAYFSSGINLYSYTVSEHQWTKLPDCKYCFSGLAVVGDRLTTVGGQARCGSAVTNVLLCFQSYSWIRQTLFNSESWEEVLPRMPTERTIPAVASTSTHLVVAGGKAKLDGHGLGTVEVLNTNTRQWSKFSRSSPKSPYKDQLVTCGRYFYLNLGSTSEVFTCTVEALTSGGVDYAWMRLTKPSESLSEFSLGILKGRLLLVGGVDENRKIMRTIHCYDVGTDSWSVTGSMPTARWGCLTAEFPSNNLMVVGGEMESCILCPYAEIAHEKK